MASPSCQETRLRPARPSAYLRCQDHLLERFDARLARRLSENRDHSPGLTLWLESETRALTRLNLSFFASISVNSDPDWQAASERYLERLQAHRRDLQHNSQVIEGIRRDIESTAPGASREERRLIEQNWEQLQRSGAFLSATDAERLQAIDDTLGELQRQFANNLDRATLRHETLINDPTQLDGLSPDLIEQARQDARDRGHAQGWVLTLKVHRLYPALRQLHDRGQRQALHRARQFRAGGLRVGQREDNPELMRRILALRLERARLLGFEHALAFQMADSGLGTADQLIELLDELERAARPAALREVARIRQAMRNDGINDEAQAWDLLYYADRLTGSNTGIDERHGHRISEERALEALFASAARMWGLTFEPINDRFLPSYSVHDAQQRQLGAVTFDLNHRLGKRGGAWMSVLQHAEHDGRGRVPAQVEIQSNFATDEAGDPMLDAAAVETLFHEFGHVLMELFSTTRHRSLAGNQLPLDAIEVPALVFERLAFQSRELSSLQARRPSRVRFGHGHHLPGLQTLREIALIRIDLAWHSITQSEQLDPEAIAAAVIADMDLPQVISAIRADDGDRSVFGQGRGGLRYRGLWANALAADVARVVMEDSDRPAVATRLREELFSRGNSRPLGESVTRFLGRDASPHALACELGLRPCEASHGASIEALAP